MKLDSCRPERTWHRQSHVRYIRSPGLLNLGGAQRQPQGFWDVQVKNRVARAQRTATFCGDDSVDD